MYYREQYNDGEWSDAVALVVGPQGEQGLEGIDAFVYVAYASDDSGSDFNLTPSDTLKYRAEIHSETELDPPTQSDFSGVTWVKYLGNDAYFPDGTAAGQVKIWNTTSEEWDNATLTEGSNISITNNDGSVTIAATGFGDVFGPGNSTDNALAKFDSTTGKIIQNSGIIISDNNKLTLPDNSIDGTINITARSTEPSSPSSGDIYLDDGSNSSSGNFSWRQYNGTGWTDIGKATNSPLTTKGDIFTYDSADTRLPVGTNGQILSADSTETTGLKWISAPGGGDMLSGTYDPASIGEQLVGLTASQTLTNKTFTSPVINVSSDAEGDIYYRNSSEAFTRLAIGSNGQVLKSNGTLPIWDTDTGGTQILAFISGENFIYPKTGITNPFTNASNSANITFDVDNYANTVVLVSSSSNEPMQLPKFKIPTGTTSLKFRFVYEPESGNSWNGETVVFKGEFKEMTDNAAWASVTAFTVGTDTVPASGSNPQLYEATVSLSTLGLSVGDVVQMVVFVDSTSTWANDVAFELCEIEVVQ